MPKAYAHKTAHATKSGQEELFEACADESSVCQGEGRGGRLLFGKRTAKPQWQARHTASEFECAKTTPEWESRTMWEKHRTFDDAKKLIAGPAGVEFEKYPLKFAIPAYFGFRPQSGDPATVNSGTASLVRIGGQSFALTCSHVLEGYRKRLAEGDCIFQLGNCELDPLAQLKVEDAKLDYALIALTEKQVKEIAKPGGPFEGTFFCEPAQWPPGGVKAGDFVAFGGFPGELRQAVSFDDLSFGSFSSGASRVASVNDDYLVSQFEREFWVKHGHEAEPETIGGMSGGPVFAIRHSAETDIMTYEFIGHIYEFSKDFELLYVRLARVLPL